MDTKILEKLRLKQSEYRLIKDLLHREPNFNELCMFSVMWSEHCAYKYSRKLLKKFPTNADFIVSGPGENAGITEIDENIYIAFKIESHNHPTAVEPYEGAATGVGGILRDIFTMGARPIALLNSLRFGLLNNNKNRYLFEKTIEGIANYGNCAGIPTIAGECYFSEEYSGNPLLNVMAAGIIYNKKVIYSGLKTVGNSIIYAGQTTGRDGMAGASFASAELNNESIKDRPAVQVGDPFSEKILMEACLESFNTGYIKSAQDMGAAGLTCSTCEMASKGSKGIEIDLSLVPTRGKNLKPFEMLMSESQERMLLEVERGKEPEVIDIFKKWGVNAVAIGKVTNDGIVKIKKKQEIIAEVTAKHFTDEAPEYSSPVLPLKRYSKDEYKFPDICIEEIENVTDKLISSPNLCSKKWIFEQFDRKVQNNTILDSQNSSSGVVRIKDQNGVPTNKAIILTVDSNSRYINTNPYYGSIMAVLESALNVAVTGGKPLAITDNLNFCSPEKPEGYSQLYHSVEGIAHACKELNIPVTGGNVSLYNETNGHPIPPTPVIGMLGVIDNADNVISPEFKDNGDIVILAGSNEVTLSNSEYCAVRKIDSKQYLPIPDIKLAKNLNKFLNESINFNLIKSAQDISEGGLLYTIFECCQSRGNGVTLSNEILKLNERIDISLFGEGSNRVILTTEENNLNKLKKLFGKYNIPYKIIGEVTKSDLIIEKTDIKLNLKELKQKWETTIPNSFITTPN